MEESIENKIISFISSNIGPSPTSDIKLIKIHHGHSVSFDTNYIIATIKEKYVLDVVLSQHPIKITCEWCAMKSSVLNSNFVCKFCGKQTELIHEDNRLSIQIIPNN